MRSPSKFLSLSFLLNLKSNYYCSRSGQDYVPCEVDELIILKQIKQSEQYYRLQIKNMVNVIYE